MKRDIRKMMALLSEANVKEQDLPFSVEKRDIEIPFISKNGNVYQRPLRIYVPETGRLRNRWCSSRITKCPKMTQR
ncbi:hypothetical protein AB9M62_41555 [Bacillales bacterium AN1005]